MKARQTIQKRYSKRHKDHLIQMEQKLKEDILQNFSSDERIDQIRVRAKSIQRFCQKAAKKEGGRKKYKDPINQIQDQLGARIVTYYLSDVEKIAETVEKYYKPIEKKDIIPDSDGQFGYEGKHYILFLPVSILPNPSGGDFPKFFELQITTLFQHAWSQAEHDLGYKPIKPIEHDEKRKIAFTAAQAWGADNIFDELFIKSHVKTQKDK